MSRAYKLAKKQRLASLKLAFKTIEVFAIPSLSADGWEKLNDVKNNLIKNYSK